MLNVQQADLEAVVAVLLALNSPTISTLSDAGWAAVNTILPEELVRKVIPRLKAAGATGIVEYRAEQGRFVMRLLKTTGRGATETWRVLGELERRQESSGKSVTPLVQRILNTVRRGGDRALRKYAAQFDLTLATVRRLQITSEEMQEAWDETSPALQEALKVAAGNISRLCRAGSYRRAGSFCADCGINYRPVSASYIRSWLLCPQWGGIRCRLLC